MKRVVAPSPEPKSFKAARDEARRFFVQAEEEGVLRRAHHNWQETVTANSDPAIFIVEGWGNLKDPQKMAKALFLQSQRDPAKFAETRRVAAGLVFRHTPLPYPLDVFAAGVLNGDILRNV